MKKLYYFMKPNNHLEKWLFVALCMLLCCVILDLFGSNYSGALRSLSSLILALTCYGLVKIVISQRELIDELILFVESASIREFKIGDKVRCNTDRETFTGVGVIVEIHEPFEYAYHVRLPNGNTIPFKKEELERIK